MTLEELMNWIAANGVVLESARGAVPNVAAHVAGEPLSGSWWTHPASREIFALTRAVREREEILVCRLVDGKITFVHRDVWPALVRLAGRFPPARLARLAEVHTEEGKHVVQETAFPQWVPADVANEAAALSETDAETRLSLLSLLN
ncbi:MAG TPA: hypothetical protein VGF28_13475 [Thermoanaerobaculia bacterium]|jgi:hypothetical protein